jgi:transposase InsO family protein
MNPNARWIAQQARQLVWILEEHKPRIRFLLRDNDIKFTEAFDTIFRSARIKVIPLPFHAPNANAYAERWVRTVCEECLDKILIINENHLRQVLKTYISHYNQSRPHQGIKHQTPIPFLQSEVEGNVQSRDVLGGIIHEYYREAA